MLESSPRKLWGILGGLGPLASAEFLNTIYEYAEWDREQDAPRLILVSDPTFHDRTDSFLEGREEKIRCQLRENLQKLRQAGATHIVICCVTMHYLLPRLLPSEGWDIVSLIDVALRGAMNTPGKHLLLCTKGTMQLQIFQQHPLWPLAAPRIIVPDESDWRSVHDLIYAIKRDRTAQYQGAILKTILERYSVESCIAGCTELHILARCLYRQKETARLRWIDPLELLARHIVGSDRLQYVSQADAAVS
jgi:aspartate racemase